MLLPLPKRVFEAGTKPHNTPGVTRYQNSKVLLMVKTYLGDDFKRIMDSFLGRYIEFAEAPNISFSRHMVHYVFQRRILTKDDSLWFAFAEQPMRFGLKEFELTTGLKCFEDSSETAARNARMERVADDLWMTERKYVHQLLDILKDLPDSRTSDEKLRLGALIVCEVLFVSRNTGTKIPVGNLQRAKKFEDMCKLPWGKFSYEEFKTSVQKLNKDAACKLYNLSGYSIAFQFWLMYSVEALGKKFGKRHQRLDSPICFQWSESSVILSYQEIAKVEEMNEVLLLSLYKCLIKLYELFIKAE